MQSEEIVAQGATDMRAGKNVKDNPYQRGTVEAIRWLGGWTVAFYEESGKAGRGKK